MKSFFKTIPLFFFLLGCVSNQPQSGEKQANDNASSSVVSKNVYKNLTRAVFEIVTPKIEDNFMVYTRPLPYDKLDFKERNDKYLSLGTAFSIEKNKYVSAAHVFSIYQRDMPRSYFIRDVRGAVYKIKNVNRYSNYRDLVEFDLESPVKDPAILKTKAAIEIGDEVLTVGNAQGQGIAIRSGQIASFTPEEQNGTWNFIRFSTPVNPGNSGGPLVTSKGEVVGVVLRRNESENLNFAIPVTELEKLNPSKAEFHVKDLSFQREQNSLNEPWDYQVPLPLGLGKLSGLAQVSFTQKVKQIENSFYEKFKDQYYPGSPTLKKYLPAQNYSTEFNFLTSDANKNWGLAATKGTRTEISPTQHMSSTSTEGANGSTWIFFYLTKKRGEPLLPFLKDQKALNDTIIKSHGWYRSFAGEKAAIESYGKPQQSLNVVDQHKRPWNVARWNTGFDSHSITLFYHAVPDGIIGTWVYAPMATMPQSETAVLRLINTSAISYSARLNEWTDYLSLGAEYLAPYFKDIKFSYNKSSKLGMELGKFNAQFENSDISPDSILSLYRGYDVQNIKKQEFQVMSVETKDSTEYYMASLKFNPKGLVSEAADKQWKNVVEQKAEFQGKPYVDDQFLRIIGLANPKKLNRNPASNETEHVVLASCGQKLTKEDKLFKSKCLQFSNSISQAGK